MNIESQVPNLELCKRLKALGFEQETYCYWYPIPKVIEKGIIIENGYEILIGKNARTYGSAVTFSAPTVAELVEELPSTIRYEKLDLWLKLIKYSDNYNCFYGWGGESRLDQQDENLSNVLAKMWIHLKENNLI
jgi:hypothetical protein